jgi:hypothetical protein
VLNSSAYLAPDNLKRPSFSSSSAPQVFILRQSLAKYYDQRCMTIPLHASCYSDMNNMQPDRQSGTGDWAIGEQATVTVFYDGSRESRLWV